MTYSHVIQQLLLYYARRGCAVRPQYDIITLPRETCKVLQSLWLYVSRICCRPSVCLLSVCRLSSVTFVHPTRVVQIFGNISTAL